MNEEGDDGGLARKVAMVIEGLGTAIWFLLIDLLFPFSGSFLRLCLPVVLLYLESVGFCWARFVSV